MKRGEVWTTAGGPDYAGKPRPAVVLQADEFDATHSVTLCPLTSSPIDAPVFRPVVAATDMNGLRADSRLMVDKITTVPRVKLERKIGRLSASELTQLNRSVFVFLGLAESAR